MPDLRGRLLLNSVQNGTNALSSREGESSWPACFIRTCTANAGIEQVLPYMLVRPYFQGMKTERVEMRVTAEWLADVDEWRKAQLAVPSRTEAIRALVELGLEAARQNTPHLTTGSRTSRASSGRAKQ